MNNPILSIENISFSYNQHNILNDINIEIEKGGIYGLIGPNGVGKSTIFNLITGLISPNSGKIQINGEEVNNYPVYLRTKKFKVGYIITQIM